MTITSPIWMRVAWLGLLVAAFFVPVFFLAIEFAETENCTPDITAKDYAGARTIALWTWGLSFLVMGLLLAAAEKCAPTALGRWPVWAAFGIWKAVTLGLAFVTSPSCFESYAPELLDPHPLEGPAAMGSVFAWGIFLAVILVGLIAGPKRHDG
ncbi:hypothetical protein [uncultured Litoreibacter sp.]|uniref:hypothetical protein n=1 Tax=uncultured Litoreibacter sp. TaxID=1392394 RepID=UPI0026255C74|nr:hypothetical protein [uncultured Litoreibacter sp.]